MKGFNFIKTAGLGCLAMSLMANQSCEQATNNRVLKYRSEPGLVQSQDFTAPGGGLINLSKSLTEQIKQVIATSQYFYISTTASSNSLASAIDEVPVCVRDVPQVSLSGDVTHFEFAGSFEGKFGYTPDGDLSGTSVTAKVKVDVAQMGLVLSATDPLTRQYLGVSSSTANETKTSVGAEINFDNFKIDPNFYFSTPLQAVGAKALGKAMDRLYSQLSQTPWEAQVLRDEDRFIIINAGARAGLKAGDILTVHNQVYRWENDLDPCNSRLLFKADQRDVPTAVIKLKTVTDFYSISEIDPERPTFEAARTGAVVRLKEYAPAPQPTQQGAQTLSQK